MTVAVEQVLRYSAWLTPKSSLCVSMLSDAKSNAIFRRLCRAFHWVTGFVYQETDHPRSDLVSATLRR